MSDSATDARPIIVAYDGTPQAKAAVREAAHLFGSGTRPVLVLTVWEPGLMNVAIAPAPGGIGAAVPPPDPEVVREVDRSEEDHARAIAEDGAALARSLGLASEALAVRDEANVADTIVHVADERDAQAVVVGSRGLSHLRSVLIGSTSDGVLHRIRRPLLIIHADEDAEAQ